MEKEIGKESVGQDSIHTVCKKSLNSVILTNEVRKDLGLLECMPCI
jgi:hypothetical protein